MKLLVVSTLSMKKTQFSNLFVNAEKHFNKMLGNQTKIVYSLTQLFTTSLLQFTKRLQAGINTLESCIRPIQTVGCQIYKTTTICLHYLNIYFKARTQHKCMYIIYDNGYYYAKF